MRTAAATAACLLATCVLAAPARAAISPAQTIDGPSADIVGFDGAAMSEDGTGGIVYRKRVDGRVHVFVSQFAGGRWRAPQRVDLGQRFDSSWPAIGAGDGGRLVVVWVQENGVEFDRLYSASLEPGARRFGAPVPVDMNVGEATDTWPAVAMARGGQAVVVYRTVENRERTRGQLPRGYVLGEYRLARFNGQLWSSLGFPLNRNPASPVAEPTAANAPKLGIEPSGNAVVAWQEPDDEFIDRVWARRVFSGQPGIALLASPQKVGEQPLRTAADQFDVDVAGFGQAVVAVRQRGRPGSAQPTTRIWTSQVGEAFTTQAATFAPPRPSDGFGADNTPAEPGPVSVATVPGAFVTAFGIGVESLTASGDDQAVARPARLDEGGSTVAGDPQVDLAPDGALVAAWKLRVARRGQVGLAEQRADGVPERRAVSAAAGGPIGTMDLAGSGFGDALVAWQQGAEGALQVAAAVVDAPPGAFSVQTPADFVKAKGDYDLEWEPAPHAIGDVRYSVLVDDEEVASNLTRRRHVLDLGKLDDGVNQVQVVARDDAGQDTSSVAATIKLDRRAPTVTLERRKGRRLRVLVRDGTKGQVAGADYAATSVTWGDGRKAPGREGANAVTHTYRRAGSYRVTVTVQDVVGNTRRVVKRVTVR